MNIRLITTALELAVFLAGYLIAVETHVGQVVTAGKGRITIIQAQDKELSFDVAADAMVLLNNKPSSLDKLTIGDQATLRVETRAEKQVVTLVDAKSANDKSDEIGDELAATSATRR